MSIVRIALENLGVPATPGESVRLATAAIADASRGGAIVICFPECFVPGYRGYRTARFALPNIADVRSLNRS